MFLQSRFFLTTSFILFSQILFAQFNERVDLYQTDYSAYDALQIDIDLDGDLDLLVYGSDEITINENLNGQGLFATPKRLIKIESDNFISNLILGDFDGDGDEDFVLSIGNEIIWMELEAGEPEEVQRLEISSGPSVSLGDLQVADIDADGQLDVIVEPAFQDKIVWFKNEGLGNFAVDQDLLVVDDLESFLVAHMDSDNLPDILTLEDGSPFDVLLLYKNEGGQGNFGSSQQVAAHNNLTYKAIDMDGDDDLDILVEFLGIGWYENVNGEGAFGSYEEIWDSFVIDFDGGDMDNDGDIDVVFSGGDRLEWIKRNADGTFADSPELIEEFPVFYDYEDIKLADVDHDDFADIIYLSGGNPEEVGWWKNNSGVAFERKFFYTNDITELMLGKVNSDSLIDIVLPNPDGYLRWVENLGELNFSAEQFVDALHNYNTNSSLEFVDVDNDGDLE